MIIKDLNFSYGEKVIFNGFNMEIKHGSTTAIMGGSGTGKTTLVNCICSQLDYDGEIIFDSGNSKIAYVFQQPRLIPSMSVEDNIKFVLPKGMDKDEINNKVNEVIDYLQLADCRKSYPSRISGGQASRVAIARALVIEADILIFDEPFKGLDISLKRDIIKLLISLIKGKNVIFITHDPEEALAIADSVYVFERKEGEGVSVKGELDIEQNSEIRDMYGDYINKLRQKLYEVL